MKQKPRLRSIFDNSKKDIPELAELMNDKEYESIFHKV